MILTFPDSEILHFALTSGAVPPSVALAPARAGAEADGRVWVRPSVNVPKNALAELRRLGVAAGKDAASPGAEVSCWLELLPLRRAADGLARPEQTPVLFSLHDGEQLASLVTEMMRLGNDRQGYRWLDGPSGGRALLRVVGPPYYSLLRALERDGDASAPVAYVEQAPRVWVQFGHRHPLGDRIKPAQGKMVLLRPPRQWTFLDDAPFRDLYEVLDFPLPAVATRWREGQLARRIAVPLRLTRGGSADAAELWVLRDDPVAQLDALVRGADDHLLARLAFAVGEEGGKTTVVLRVRPSKLAPPELVLQAVGFRPYLKLPNLFLPVGTRLHPPLRRDAVRKHLADDPALVTWLSPEAGGGFTPESLPDDAFRPLADWIDYVLEHDHQALTAWVESTRFEFDDFVCADDQLADRPQRSPKVARERPAAPVKAPRDKGTVLPDATVVKTETPAQAETPEPTVPVSMASDVVREQLTALEEQFLAVEGGLDAKERLDLWPRLAELNARLASADDAGVCWMNALWARDEAPTAWAEQWLRAEASAVSSVGGAAKAPAFPAEAGDVTGDHLDRALATSDPATAEVRTLAAYVFWAGCQSSPPAAVAQRLGRLQHYLEGHERLIPVRATWLTWLGLTRLAGGDALALARARDRLLERLYRSGLRPEQDLPSFLRFSGAAGSQRFRTVRTWLAGLADKAQRWAREKGRTFSGKLPRTGTGAYIDLFFAFGLARLGESDAARQMLARAARELTGDGAAHAFLRDAFSYRVRQATDGKPHGGPLPPDLMARLAALIEDRKQKGQKAGVGPEYYIDRMRWLSRILEPDQKVEPYRHIYPYFNEVERLLKELPDEPDRAQVADRVRGLLAKMRPGADRAEAHARVLRAALDQAPRVGEDFALEMLRQTPDAFDALPPALDKEGVRVHAELLEKGMFVAAHFDKGDVLGAFVARFQKMLEAPQQAAGVQAIDAVAGQCFRGLRKFGMHKEIDGLLGVMARQLLQGRDLKALDADWAAANPEALRALLQVAGGWYYFGRDGQAEAVTKTARAVLFSKPLPAPKKAPIACAYAAVLGQAPVEVARERVEELFAKLEGLPDTFTTSDHYARFQLELVEAVVLAVASDDFTHGGRVRRWLDDDEYLVRRRVHQDVRRLVSN